VPAAPRPATLIAIAALVVASSGGAFAAGSPINGASIKNGSIPGTKLTPHTLSGPQITVARLGTLPLPVTLPHRQSLSGLYAVVGTGHANQAAVSFLIPVASAPTAHFIAPGAAPRGSARDRSPIPSHTWQRVHVRVRHSAGTTHRCWTRSPRALRPTASASASRSLSPPAMSGPTCTRAGRGR
jgi:hypothetical protein